MVRNAILEGRPHKVVPMVMLVEGVAHGSQGPILYTRNEIAKAPRLWDHKPIVRYHPERDGHGVSACNAEVLNAQKVGIILNSKVDNKGPGGLTRLTAEAWLDVGRVNEVDSRIAKTIHNQKVMEVSTGLFMDIVPVEHGVFNGKEYEGMARNFIPDHLAILPDRKGACSVADGAGLIRNEAWVIYPIDEDGDGEEDKVLDDMDEDNEIDQKNKGKVLGNAREDQDGYDDDESHGPSGEDAKVAASSVGVSKTNPVNRMKRGKGNKREQKISVLEQWETSKAKYRYIVKNDMSSNDLRDALQAAIKERFGKKVTQDGKDITPYYWVQDVFRKFFIYSVNNVSYRLSYSVDEDDMIVLGREAPVECVRVTQYKNKKTGEVLNELVGNFIRPAGKGKFKVVSHTGKDLTKPMSKAGAEKRLAQIEYFKHTKNESSKEKYKWCVSNL